MKNLMKLSVMALFALTTILTSCAKYDEGSNFSILPAKARAVNDWKLSKVTYNGNDVTSLFPISSFNVKSDNNIDVTYTILGNNSVDNGTWKFSDDKKQFIWINKSGSTSTYEIVRLANAEMKLQQKDANNNATVFTFITR